MPQVRALKTFNASRYGYMVRAGSIFTAENRYAEELAQMGMVKILPDTTAPDRAKLAKENPKGKVAPPVPPPAPANPNPTTADSTDAGTVKVSPSSRPARRSPRATAVSRVEYPTKP
jgi:hypothetical protein